VGVPASEGETERDGVPEGVDDWEGERRDVGLTEDEAVQVLVADS
jgi:hypothetical protein